MLAYTTLSLVGQALHTLVLESSPFQRLLYTTHCQIQALTALLTIRKGGEVLGSLDPSVFLLSGLPNLSRYRSYVFLGYMLVACFRFLYFRVFPFASRRLHHH